jgi:putative tryptophan/tyrosine transport system permease protein
MAMDSMVLDFLQTTLELLQATLEQGSLYALVALALLLTFQVIRFPDLTPDGSFTLGAAMVGKAIHAFGAPFTGVIAAFIAGAISGSLTAFLSSRFKISRILSGILVMTGLYTVSLRIMGRGNLQLIEIDTVLTPFEVLTESGAGATAALVVFALLAYIATWGLLRSEIGLFLIATGQNPIVAESKGRSADRLALWGVALANGIIASSGSRASYTVMRILISG